MSTIQEFVDLRGKFISLPCKQIKKKTNILLNNFLMTNELLEKIKLPLPLRLRFHICFLVFLLDLKYKV